VKDNQGNREDGMTVAATEDEILNTYPKDGAENVPIDSKIKIFFNGERSPSDYEFTFSPFVEGKVTSHENSVIFTPSDSLKEGLEYKVTVKSTKNATSYNWTFTTALPGPGEEELDKAIKSDVISWYGFNKDTDKLEKYYGDFDRDGVEEVLVVLRSYKEMEINYVKDNWETLHIFIFKPAGSDYKLVFEDELVPGLAFYSKWAEVKVINTSDRDFLGFKITRHRGCSFYGVAMFVYTYDSSVKTYKEVFMSTVEQQYFVFKAEFYKEGDNVWIEVLGDNHGTSVMPKYDTKFYRWNGKEFVLDHIKKYDEE